MIVIEFFFFEIMILYSKFVFLQARIAFLQGERKGQENLKQDLVRRIKMLEYALKQERYSIIYLKKLSACISVHSYISFFFFFFFVKSTKHSLESSYFRLFHEIT